MFNLVLWWRSPVGDLREPLTPDPSPSPPSAPARGEGRPLPPGELGDVTKARERASGRVASVDVMRRMLSLPKLLQIARELRRNQTPAEEILWALLRGRKCLGLKFRRQHRVGTFLPDFYCHEARLVIEVDGGVHSAEEQAERDRSREAWLRKDEHRLLRFKNEQVLDDPESALREIARTTGRWWE